MRKSLLAAAIALAAGSAFAVPTLKITLIDTGGGVGSTKTCEIDDTLVVISGCVSAGGPTGGAWSFSFLHGTGNLSMSFSGFVGGYQLDAESSSSNTPGNTTQAQVTMAYNQIRNNSSAGRLFVNIEAYEFTLPTGPELKLFGGAAITSAAPGSAATQSIDWQGYVNNANGSPPQTGATASLTCGFDPVAATACTDPLDGKTWTRLATSFSMENALQFDLDIGSQVGGSSFTRTAIPEPMSLALVGLGLFGAAFFSRRRKAAEA